MSIAAIKQFFSTWFNRAMTEPDINSRLVFFVHGVGSTVVTLLLAVAFIFSHDKASYPYMVGAVAGGSFGAAAGRYMTKKNGGDAEAPSLGDKA